MNNSRENKVVAAALLELYGTKRILMSPKSMNCGRGFVISQEGARLRRKLPSRLAVVDSSICRSVNLNASKLSHDRLPLDEVVTVAIIKCSLSMQWW